MNRRFATFLILALALTHVPCVACAPALAADTANPEAAAPAPIVASEPLATATQLMAAVERAWKAGDAPALASLCDSASVRIAVKPGTPPAAAPTLSAATFLIRDQLALVGSLGFQVTRLETNAKQRTARAWARWRGTFGGTHVARDIEVVLTARAGVDGSWLLTEIRAND